MPKKAKKPTYKSTAKRIAAAGLVGPRTPGVRETFADRDLARLWKGAKTPAAKKAKLDALMKHGSVSKALKATGKVAKLK